MWKWVLRAIIALAVFGLLNGASSGESDTTIAGGVVVLAIFAVAVLPSGLHRRLLAPVRRRRRAEPAGDRCTRCGARRSGRAEARTSGSPRRVRCGSRELANIPAGRALHLDGVRWELLTLTPAHRAEPWRTLTTGTAA